MKHEQCFNDFLSNHVNLNETRIDTLESRTKTIVEVIKKNLDGYRKYSPQGSYAHKTIIKPVKENDEFDADLIVLIKDKDFDPNEFKTDYVHNIHQIFKNDGNYAGKVKKGTRCATIDYAGDFHLDLVPCIECDEDFYICNGKDKVYEKTDGEGYKDWLMEKNSIIGNNNFRKVTRLLKFLRDHKDNFTVKSILLTTLLGQRVCDNDKGSEDFVDLPTSLKTISNRLNCFLQNHVFMPTVSNPVMPCEDFNRHWDDRRYANFRSKFDSYNTKINEAFEEKDHNQSVKKWRQLFGDNFGIEVSKPHKSAVILPPVIAKKPYANVK